MKYLLLLFLIGCINDSPESTTWTGRGYVTFGEKSSDTVSCTLVLHGDSGILTMGSISDTLFNVSIDNFKYSGSVHGKYDTNTFEFYDFTGHIEGSYSLEPDNGIYRIRHFNLMRN